MVGEKKKSTSRPSLSVKSRVSKCEAPIPNGTVTCLRRHRSTRNRTNRTTANVYPAASCLILTVCPPFVCFSAVSLCCGAARSNYARVFWDSVGVFAAFCGLPKLKRAAIGFALAALVSVSKHSGRLLEIQLGKLLAPALTQRKMTDKIENENARDIFPQRSHSRSLSSLRSPRTGTE